MKLLLTGFGPYGQHRTNPSQLVSERLGGVILPVSAQRTPVALRSAIERAQPDLVLCLGLAPTRTEISIERVAINVLDFPFPDHDGRQPLGEPVVEGGPAAYFSTVPVKAVLAAWQEAEIPSNLSNTAGTFCCNQALYTALHLGHRAGFIHLPLVSALPLEAQIRAVEIAIETLATATADPKLAAGAVN